MYFTAPPHQASTDFTRAFLLLLSRLNPGLSIEEEDRINEGLCFGLAATAMVYCQLNRWESFSRVVSAIAAGQASPSSLEVQELVDAILWLQYHELQNEFLDTPSTHRSQSLGMSHWLMPNNRRVQQFVYELSPQQTQAVLARILNQSRMPAVMLVTGGHAVSFCRTQGPWGCINSEDNPVIKTVVLPHLPAAQETTYLLSINTPIPHHLLSPQGYYNMLPALPAEIFATGKRRCTWCSQFDSTDVTILAEHTKICRYIPDSVNKSEQTCPTCGVIVRVLTQEKTCYFCVPAAIEAAIKKEKLLKAYHSNVPCVTCGNQTSRRWFGEKSGKRICQRCYGSKRREIIKQTRLAGQSPQQFAEHPMAASPCMHCHHIHPINTSCPSQHSVQASEWPPMPIPLTAEIFATGKRTCNWCSQFDSTDVTILAEHTKICRYIPDSVNKSEQTCPTCGVIVRVLTQEKTCYFCVPAAIKKEKLLKAYHSNVPCVTCGNQTSRRWFGEKSGKRICQGCYESKRREIIKQTRLAGQSPQQFAEHPMAASPCMHCHHIHPINTSCPSQHSVQASEWPPMPIPLTDEAIDCPCGTPECEGCAGAMQGIVSDSSRSFSAASQRSASPSVEPPNKLVKL